MTTVVLDVLKKEVVSDSLAIETGVNGDIFAKHPNTKKLFKSECGKFIASASGCLILSERVLRNLNFTVDSQFGYVSNKGNISDILIINKYNHQVKYIRSESTLTGVSKEVKYYNGCTRVVMGSGQKTADLAYDKVQDASKAVRYAAMKDKGTNDILQRECL